MLKVIHDDVGDDDEIGLDGDLNDAHMKSCTSRDEGLFWNWTPALIIALFHFAEIKQLKHNTKIESILELA